MPDTSKPTKVRKETKAAFHPIKILADAAHDLLTTHRRYLETAREEEEKREAIEKERDRAIEAIRAKKELLVDHLNKEFDHRAKILDRGFEDLDEALASGDMKRLEDSLNTVLDTVRKSPMPDSGKFLKDFHDPKKTIEI